MKIHSLSGFKDPVSGLQWLNDWNLRVRAQASSAYEQRQFETALGSTNVWVSQHPDPSAEALVVFPGFRTCALIWELDGMLAPLHKRYRIYLVDTNGQPSLSTGNTPPIKEDGYGVWAASVLEKLGIDQAVVMGASFGGLVCLKLARMAPAKVRQIFLLNPGCLAPFSMALPNLYNNLLPLISPTERNVRRFLDKAVFHKPSHQLSEAAEKLLVEYELQAIRAWKDKAQKPYSMPASELEAIHTETYLFEGDMDPLFPYQKSIAKAKAELPGLKGVEVFQGVAHGIELSSAAIHRVATLAI